MSRNYREGHFNMPPIPRIARYYPKDKKNAAYQFARRKATAETLLSAHFYPYLNEWIVTYRMNPINTTEK